MFQGYGAETYGDRIADIYDEPGHCPDDAETMADRLANLARLCHHSLPDQVGGSSGQPTAPEIGVGTGRAALPLVARGIRVVGVDPSGEMLKRLEGNDPGNTIEAHQADFASFDAGRKFSLVYCVYNTLFYFLDREHQVQAVLNAARHMLPGGFFVVQTFVPTHDALAKTEWVLINEIDVNQIMASFCTHDVVNSTITAQLVTIRDGDIRLRPVKTCYATPAEIDLMARAAGLKMVDRFADWSGAPFTQYGGEHVTTYQLPTPT